MKISNSDLCDEILVFCLHNPQLIQSNTFDLPTYFANKHAEPYGATVAFEGQQVQAAIDCLMGDNYLKPTNKAYVLTPSGMQFAKTGGYLERIKEKRRNRA